MVVRPSADHVFLVSQKMVLIWSERALEWALNPLLVSRGRGWTVRLLPAVQARDDVLGPLVAAGHEVRVRLERERPRRHAPKPLGGILELDGTFEESVRREVHEETGVWVKVDRLTGVYKNMTHGIVTLVSSARRKLASSPQPTNSAKSGGLP
jgi:hypothetical protein